jgi:hypothetical protein
LTFCAKLRGLAAKVTPPPTKIGAVSAPWRAPPPFCFFDFLVVPRDFRAGLLRLGAGATGRAVRGDQLVDQVLVELAAEHVVGNRHALALTHNGEFHCS